MNKVKQWILIEPLDTLFFKGSEPMIAGENHEVHTIFPPMPSTSRGSLITAIIQQRCLSLKDFLISADPSKGPLKDYPLLGMPGQPGFEILGPVFRVNTSEGKDDWFIPAPAHWFAAVPDNAVDGEEIVAVIAEEIPQRAISLGLCGSVSKPVWLSNPRERDMKSLAGYLINIKALKTMKDGSCRLKIRTTAKQSKANEPSVLGLGTLFWNESRVGIALEILTRRAKEGHLYSTTHVRLEADVTLVLGLSQKLIPEYLDRNGILQLGGEQRLVRYKECLNPPDLIDMLGPWVLSLSSFPFDYLKNYGWEEFLRVSGPLIRMGGWDMKTSFHKPMTAYLPAGSVIKIGEKTEVPFGFLRI